MENVEYDTVADVYDFRYQNSYKEGGIPKRLHEIISQHKIKNALEVGCGTGHWLNVFSKDIFIVGLDKSYGMLTKANKPNTDCLLVQSTASQIPVKSNQFDLVYCINAIHHFPDPELFFKECSRVLKRGGVIVIICMNPHPGSDDWFVYDYFQGTRENDRERYPSPANLEHLLTKSGFEKLEFQIAERLKDKIVGEDIFKVPKDYTSQLSLLTDSEYKAGMERIREHIRSSVQSNQIPVFNVDISLSMVTATLSGEFPNECIDPMAYAALQPRVMLVLTL